MSEKTGDSDLVQLEKDFQEVINELAGEPALEKFKAEFEKVHNALIEANLSNTKLAEIKTREKCRELNAEIVSNSTKVSEALKIGEDDQSSISQLQSELEKAWVMLDASNEKENRARETIKALKIEVENLTKLVENNTETVVGHDSSMKEIMRQKQELKDERDALVKECDEHRAELEKNTERIISLEDQTARATHDIAELKQEIQFKTNDAAKALRAKEKLEKEISVVATARSAAELEAKKLSDQLAKKKAEHDAVVEKTRAVRIAADRAQKDIKNLDHKLQKTNEDLLKQQEVTGKLGGEKTELLCELRIRDDEISTLKNEINRNNKVMEKLKVKLQKSESDRIELDKKRDDLKGKAAALERDRDIAVKLAEVDKKQIEELARERDILDNNLLKAASATAAQVEAVKLHVSHKKNLECEIASYREESTKQRKIIFQLEKEREKYITSTMELNVKINELSKDMRISKLELFDYQKQIAEYEARLKQQQSMNDTVRADRNLYLKNLTDSQEEINELRKKIKIMTYQVDQFKDEISNKEASLVKVNLEHARIEKEKEALRADIQRLKNNAGDSDRQLESMEKQISNLQQIIREAEVERQGQQKTLEKVLTERDLLGTQLVRRNDELALLHEKTKLQTSEAIKGEQHYKMRLDDIRILKTELAEIRREKKLLKKNLNSAEHTQREVHKLSSELIREKTRCRALEEELENPMNIHRWRRLEGADPSTYELIQQVHALQKRLIEKTAEIVQKEFKIKEKEACYVELREILARQPGPEAAEQLAEYQRCMRNKTKQLKRLVAELNVAEMSMSEQETEIGRISNELKEVKQKYLEMKKNEALARNQRHIPAGKPPKPNTEPKLRFAGGGFNLKQANALQKNVLSASVTNFS